MKHNFVRSLISTLIATLVSTAVFSAKFPVIIDHDGGIDDILSVMLVSSHQDIDTRAIILTPADSWLAPNLDITRTLIRKMGVKNTTISTSLDQGKNKFPVAWRNDSYKMLSINALLPSLTLEDDAYVDKTPAVDKLIALLSTGEQFDLLITGPMSNLAQALERSPEISRNIHEVYFMGGAFRADGNVDLDNHPHLAEWNVFNNPNAVNIVLSHQVPVTFIPLDATNKAPVTSSFIQSLEAQSSYDLSDTALKLLQLVSPQIGHDDYQKRYFFWDVLTAAALLDNEIIKTKTIHTKVATDGVSEGQTQLVENGYLAKMAYDVDTAKLESFILDRYRQNFIN
tara:strand:+ start:1764 stop:2786 length:1023 start_codon:yes stop_codon:yes gene_type:complete